MVVKKKEIVGTAIKEIYKKKTVIPYLGRTEAKLPSTPVKVRTDGGNLSWEAVSGAYYAVYKSNGEGKLATRGNYQRDFFQAARQRDLLCHSAG